MVSCVWVWHYANSPAVGTVAIKKNDNPNVSDSTTKFATLANGYFSLLYPTYLNPDLVSQETKDTFTYDYFSRRDDSHKVKESLEVYLKKLPDGGLTLDQDYKNYVSQPKQYKLVNKYYGGELVSLAIRNSGAVERNAMWVHGDYLLIVKMTGADKDDTEADVETILKSVQWHVN